MNGKPLVKNKATASESCDYIDSLLPNPENVEYLKHVVQSIAQGQQPTQVNLERNEQRFALLCQDVLLTDCHASTKKERMVEMFIDHTTHGLTYQAIGAKHDVGATRVGQAIRRFQRMEEWHASRAATYWNEHILDDDAFECMLSPPWNTPFILDYADGIQGHCIVVRRVQRRRDTDKPFQVWAPIVQTYGGVTRLVEHWDSVTHVTWSKEYAAYVCTALQRGERMPKPAPADHVMSGPS